MSAVDPNGSPVIVVGGGGASLPTDDAGAILAGVTVPIVSQGNPLAGLVAVDQNGDSVGATAADVHGLLLTDDPADLIGGATASRVMATDTNGAGALLTPAQLAALVRPQDLPLLGSWTLTNGDLAGASAASSNGTLVITLPSSGTQTYATGANYAGAGVTIAPFNPACFYVQARLAQISNISGCYAKIFLRKDELAASDQVGFQIHGSGGAAGWYVWSGGGASGGSAGTVPTDGTWWCRVELIATAVRYWGGAGTISTPPSTWTLYGSLTLSNVANVAPPRFVLAAWPNSALGSVGTVTWANVSMHG